MDNWDVGNTLTMIYTWLFRAIRYLNCEETAQLNAVLDARLGAEDGKTSLYMAIDENNRVDADQASGVWDTLVYTKELMGEKWEFNTKQDWYNE